MHDSDGDYYVAREIEELERANVVSNPAVARTHLQLAKRYASLIRQRSKIRAMLAPEEVERNPLLPAILSRAFR